MKRRQILKYSCGTAIAAGIAGCTGADDDDTSGANDVDQKEHYEWQLSGVQAPDHPYIQTAELFADRLEENTDGRMQIDVAAGGQYGSGQEEVETLAAGGLDFVINSVSYEATVYFIDYLIQTNYMFVMDNNQHYLNVQERVAEEMNYDQYIQDQGVKRFGPGYYINTLNIFGSDPYPSPDVVDGVDKQIPPAPGWPETLEECGFTAHNIPNPETYQAFQTGQVEATTTDASAVIGQSLYEVGDVFTHTDHFYVNCMFTTNMNLWESLTDEDRGVLEDTAHEIRDEAVENNRQQEEDDIAAMQEQGVEYVEVDREAYLEVVEPVVRDLIDQQDDPVLTYEEIRELSPET